MLRHIVITGASSGIGRALAEHYAGPGVMLSLTGRNAERLAAVVRGCEARGAMVASSLIDVTDRVTLADWLESRDTVQSVDVVVAAAGIGGAEVVPEARGESADLAGRIFATNTLGVVNTVAPLLARMVARRTGAVVVIGSIAGRIGLPQSPAYSASKAAVHIYADGLRRLVASSGVSVTSVVPGFVDTPMSRSLAMSRPFCWSADRAARRIARAIERRERRCIFPLPLRIATALHHFVPLALLDRVLGRANTVIRPGRADP
ncbi:MAG TPA: SDR family NAD(P)-dependent oxidoreductase [Beijerinckiaceae bacterium]|nr:SDR family NAD(P)-dependent oxidoreductase [Beijerinckiaceae bacterium]